MILITILVAPGALPLVSFGIGCLLWGIPFVRARWRLIAWYYGLLSLLLVVSYVLWWIRAPWWGNAVFGIGTFIFWIGSVAGGLLVPKRPRIVVPLHLCSKCQ